MVGGPSGECSLIIACDQTLLHMLIFGNKKQTSQKYYRTLIYLTMLGNMQKVSHFSLLSTNEKKCKTSVRAFLPRALQLIVSKLCSFVVPYIYFSKVKA